MLVVLIYKKFILDDWFVIFLIIYGCFLMLYGLLNNHDLKAFIAHFQPLFLPILGISYGYFVAKFYPAILIKFYASLPALGFFLLVTGALYFYLYKVGNLGYFGASSLIILPLIWALLENKKIFSVLLIAGILISGKRSDLVSTVWVLFIFLYRTNPKKIIIIIIPVLILLINLLLYSDIFDRFVDIYNAIEASDLDRLNAATSNRINDIIGAVYSINESWFYWVFGQGFGVTYQYDAITYMHTVHYCHFSPVAYILLGGVVLLLPISIKFCYLLYFSIINYRDFFNLFFIYLCSLCMVGGAIFFTNPFFWIVVGIVVFNSRHAIKSTSLHSSIEIIKNQ